ncbi:HutD/Ves family protein [Isobaculum melis]|uniref:Various environmental stresses-induced protein Ves n=1 Tax=Isobaculum melis TaxID=142588 RepID=A0A1H9UC71_9LACT|nr:HutD family protein [Isobaculum melis]SES06757.1 Various environmental stresses-induced protein Ves [Isobaculum melis]
MKQNIIRTSDDQVTKWSGGETKELFISPPDGDYAKQKFDYRISSATVELPESTFSCLAGYQRILMVLKGEITLEHQEGEQLRTVQLQSFEQDHFSGSNETHSQGLCVDFNLIYRPEYQGKVLPITSNQSILLKPTGDYLIYCLHALKVIIHPQFQLSKQVIQLEKGESLFLSDIETETTICLQSDESQNDVAFAVVVELLQSK